jgi:hypothetical protein
MGIPFATPAIGYADGVGESRTEHPGMGDDRDSAIIPHLSDRRAARRCLIRLVGGSLLALLAMFDGNGVNAHARRRRTRKRHTRRSSTTLPPDPVACDSPAPSGIAGLVLIGPMCPVESLDDPCPDQPFVADLVVRDAQGAVICTTASGTDGRFRIGLPPGTYELDPQSGNVGGLPYAAPQSVAVETGQYTEVTVTFDSGIR